MLTTARDRSNIPAPTSAPQDAYIVENYSDKVTGEEKSKYHMVGSVISHKKGGGNTLYITPGMSISGEIVIFPRRERAADGPTER